MEGEREGKRESESESEWFIEKCHGPLSVVVTNTVKQLQVNVRPHRYNICPDRTVLRASKALCRKVASRSWRYLFSEANNIDNLKGDVHLTFLKEERETDRQTGRQAGRQRATQRQTDRCTLTRL